MHQRNVKISLLVLIVCKTKNVDGVPWMINAYKEMIKVLCILGAIFIVTTNVMEDNAINIRLVLYSSYNYPLIAMYQ